MSANSKNGSNSLTGGAGNDHINGGSGDDVINGMGGNDRINGGSGNDTMDGGSGNDIVNGDAGDDTGIYILSENAGSTDVYDGGSGRDTLQLVMTRAEWQSPAVQADISRFLAFLAQVTNPMNGQASNANFTFSFGLTVSKFEALKITVDGVAFDPRDEAVTLSDDVMAAGEDSPSLSVNVLANDSVPDLIATLTNTQPAHGSVTLVRTTGSGATPDAASFIYTPNAGHWQYLAAGQTATDTFTYTVTDSDGDTRTATVTVTITGANDAPTLGAAVTAGAVVENGVTTASGDVSFADVDLADGHTVTTAAQAEGYLGTFTASISNVSAGDGAGVVAWSFAVDDAAIQHLAAGQVLTQTYQLTVADGQGGSVVQPVTVTITGTNDAPTITAAGANGAVAEDGDLTAEGSIQFADVDITDTHTVSSTAGGSNYLGVFTATLTEDGSISWSFSLDDAAAEDLNSNDVLTQTYAVTVDDGAGGTVSQEVTVTITGNDDNTAPTVVDLTLTGTSTNTGGFAFPLVFAGHSIQSGLVVYNFADTNGDGRPDAPGDASPLQNSNNYAYNYGLALGDLDGDGDVDVVVAGDQGLLSYTNVGDVTGDGFADYQLSTLVPGWGSYDVALADLNGDGRLDIVSSRYYEGLVELTNLGDANGDGLANDFTSRTLGSTTYSSSYGITTADMNGDGRDDILVANYYGQSMLYLNGGDANNDGLTDYTSQVIGTGGYYADMGIDTGDIDGDGDIDFVMGQWNGNYNNLFLNDGDTNGDGQIDFTQVQLASGTGTYTMESAMVDIDGDGDLDIVAVDAGYGRTVISYNEGDLNNDGRPDFTHQTLQGNYAYGLAVGDIDDDGDLDIVIPTPYNGSTYLQNLGDVDGDGQLDFVAVALDSATASWDAAFTPIGSGGGGGGTGVREDGRTITGTFGGDDVDDDDDATTLTYTITSDPSEGTVVNNGDGTFSFSPGSGFQDLALGETRTVTFTYTATDSHGAVSNTGTVTVNVAGANDRVVAGADTGQAQENGPAITGNVLSNDSDVDASDVLSVSQVNGSSQQVGVQVMLASGAKVLVNADGNYIYDPNGAFEGLAAGETATDTFTYQVTDGHGGQVTQTVTITIVGSNDAPTVSDVRTGEAGFPLVFSGYGSTGLAVYSFVDSNNDGRVDTPDASSPLSNNANFYNSRMAVGDIDGDGDADVVIGGNGVTTFTNVGDVTGDGTDDFVQTQLSGIYTEAVELVDLNGDDLLDIVAPEYYGSLTQFINQGDANNDGVANDFAVQSSYSSVSYSRGIAAGDFNGDGRADLIVSGYYNTAVLMNIGDTNNDGQIDYSSQQVYGSYYNNGGAAVGDIDGDGDDDFVLSRGWDSEVVYVNNGDTNGDGQIDFSTVNINSGGYTEESELVDIDGDGDLDIVSSGYYGDPSIAYNQGDTNNDGSPDFIVQNLYSQFTSYGNRGIAVGDIDGDGDLDIVIPSEGGNTSYLSNEGDTNNDGLLDFVAVPLNGVGSSWDADFAGSGGGAREDGPAILGRFRGDDADSDDDRDSLTYTITSQPSEGSVINNGDGTFSFSPGADFQDLNAGESRTVTFTYTATDSHGVVSNVGTVSVTVAGADDVQSAGALAEGGAAKTSITLETSPKAQAPASKDDDAQVLPGQTDAGDGQAQDLGPQVLPSDSESIALSKVAGPQVLPGEEDEFLPMPNIDDVREWTGLSAQLDHGGLPLQEFGPDDFLPMELKDAGPQVLPGEPGLDLVDMFQGSPPQTALESALANLSGDPVKPTGFVAEETWHHLPNSDAFQ